jgi:hypothetical protein
VVDRGYQGVVDLMGLGSGDGSADQAFSYAMIMRCEQG